MPWDVAFEGIEAVEDLWTDLDRALRNVRQE
jgi:cystathionine beta-lyase/cystathionine gamma-synthase